MGVRALIFGVQRIFRGTSGVAGHICSFGVSRFSDSFVRSFFLFVFLFRSFPF